MKGKLRMERVTRDGKRAIKIIVEGNVGQANRDKLDALGMEAEADLSNYQTKTVSDPIELGALRDALIAQGIIEIPSH